MRALEEKLALYSEQAAVSPRGSPGHAEALGGVASAASALALRGRFDPQEAERLLREAIQAQDAAGLQVSLIDAENGSLATRVQLALLLGPGEQSSRALDEALAGLRSRSGWSFPWYAWWLQARLLAEAPIPQPGPALAAAEAAVARSAADDAVWEHARSLLMRAHVRWKSGDRPRARADGLAAISALEGLRRRQWDARTRMRYEDTLAFAYELVAGSLLDVPDGAPPPEDVDEALVVMERLRSRTLLESLVRRVPPDVGEGAAAVGQAHRMLLRSGIPAEERMQWVERLRRAERGLAAAVVAGGVEDAVAPPSMSALQAVLRPDEALVSFQQWNSEPDVDAPYTQGSSWAVVVTPASRRAVRIAGGRELEPVARLWLSLLERRDGSESRGGERLATALLWPVLEVLPPGVSSLIVVPDGVVHRLPLEALPTSSGGPLLGERHQVTIVPSAAVWFRLRSAPPRQPGLPLALSDPPLSGPARRELERIGAGTRLEIPESRTEASAAVAAFPSGGRLLTGADARKDALTGPAAREFALIHVATHALLDVARPERSALVLAPGPGDDGLVPLDENLPAAARPHRGGALGLSLVRGGPPSGGGDAQPRPGLRRGGRPGGGGEPDLGPGRRVCRALRRVLPAARARSTGGPRPRRGQAGPHPSRSPTCRLGQLRPGRRFAGRAPCATRPGSVAVDDGPRGGAVPAPAARRVQLAVTPDPVRKS